MSKYEKMWEPIYIDFENHHPDIANNIVDWYPSGQMEITVRLSNGDKISYDWMTKSIGRVYECVGPEEYLNEEDWRFEFANRLRKKMRRFGATQDTLSEETGISRITISKYLNGRATPSTYNLQLIARALRCSPSELLYI